MRYFFRVFSACMAFLRKFRRKKSKEENSEDKDSLESSEDQDNRLRKGYKIMIFLKIEIMLFSHFLALEMTSFFRHSDHSIPL